ncbi:MAG: hypothetical protein Q9M94_03025 [Candidatus Gracilibacteria bacterium]|nr:hypothetical protein [Candidatus Gracilibacteria bacterium]MDQ7023574.1 hypothetical protein [Candidatus Gracilibacteria bacterium]
MTIITSQKQFDERLHRAKLDVVQGRTYSSFEEVKSKIREMNNIKKEKELCIK